MGGGRMLVLSELSGSIGSIILNRPEKRNALSCALIDEIIAAMAEFETLAARVVVISATTAGNVWSAGHDISELPQGEDPLAYADPLERLLRCLRRSPLPVIGMV